MPLLGEVDRVVQIAAVLVLEPIFEADLEPEQHAYRRAPPPWTPFAKCNGYSGRGTLEAGTVLASTNVGTTVRGRTCEAAYEKSLVRKPGAGKLHARFDERDVDTGHGEAGEAPATEGPETDMPSLKPSRHISTLLQFYSDRTRAGSALHRMGFPAPKDRGLD